jgi:hypothetical protein
MSRDDTEPVLLPVEVDEVADGLLDLLNDADLEPNMVSLAVINGLGAWSRTLPPDQRRRFFRALGHVLSTASLEDLER